MHPQRIVRNPNVSFRSIVIDFIDRINYNIIYQLPCNGNANVLAAYARNGDSIIKILTGLGLFRSNIEKEAIRLRIRNRRVIKSATEKIWNLHLTTLQRDRFERLANDANNFNQNGMQFYNENTLDRIAGITLQVTNSRFEDNFYNGTVFNVCESIMPGCWENSNFL
ncbi:10225_t:CDS:1 [Funneliformis geosporum]|uniref:916_t:CDS:1 n=1 Tax=Funneliformis geosporum TaxID=1117311 RepID=A0A9W4SI49_9GLOM|nr:916_t:CDS:1 [Funneliformis geosporum]CAI2181364.1 10225_t:CDS:1 [Funneliformis geosporum]